MNKGKKLVVQGKILSKPGLYGTGARVEVQTDISAEDIREAVLSETTATPFGADEITKIFLKLLSNNESKQNTNGLLKSTNLVDEESKEESLDEYRSCSGCIHISTANCVPHCWIGNTYPKRCEKYEQPPKPEVTEVIKKLKEIIVSINDKEWQEFRDMSAGQILEIIESEIKALEEQEGR